MSLHDENGFLGGKIIDWVQQHRESQKSVLRLAQQLNRECHAFIDGRAVTVSDTYKLTTIVLFARLLELYQGVLLVVDRGMRAPTRVMFRAFLEGFFHFAAIHKDPTYLNDYLDQFEYQRKTLVNRIRHTTDPALEGLRQPISAELVEEIGKIDVRRIGIEEVARRGDCHGIYVTAYTMLSRAVHCSAADLEAHLEYDAKEERIVGFRYGPTDEETQRTVCLAGMTMADSLRDVSEDFAEDRRELCDGLKDSFQSLLPNLEKSDT